ncbi:uncharacterized protein FMAN_07635 [Fusarium mangiferae]|uniref:Uncharacterized protein n=1 Tax=Fusarium mangiferae TaxID=192010 RepID=A0A1L7T7T5_FUSMA|nr:uncharacterized protein FMAN_07635 [Fusarium mangiferae]CVK92792.1 uncharacterized protein FMAN_07635 [Fusarium mangiferae]
MAILEEKCLQAFVETATEPIYHLLKGLSTKAVIDLLDQPPSVQRATTAETLAVELRRQTWEDDHVWYRRLSTWVRENSTMAVSEARSDRGHAFLAIALPLPPDRSTGPQASRSPTYLDFQMRTLIPSGQIHNFLNGLFTAGYDDKETKTQVPATIAVPNHPGIEVNLYHRPDDTTARTECDAITNINARAEAVDETVVGGFWKCSHNFH